MYFNPIDFGKRLQQARNAAGLTQMQLAEKVSVDNKHISRLEHGDRACSIDLLFELTEALNISADYLLKGKSCDAVSVSKASLNAVIKQIEAIRDKLP